MYLGHVGKQASDSIHVINDVSDVHEQRVTVDRKTRHTLDVLGNRRLRVRKMTSGQVHYDYMWYLRLQNIYV